MTESGDVSKLLMRHADGDPDAANGLFEAVHSELKRVAEEQFRREPDRITLSPTALVHEVYVRLVGGAPVRAPDKAQFLALAAKMMRNLLVDHARKRRAQRRGGGRPNLRLDSAVLAAEPDHEFDDLHEALAALEQRSERLARVVELRVFGGCTIEEVADLVAMSPRTVDNDWRAALAWLRRELSRR